MNVHVKLMEPGNLFPTPTHKIILLNAPPRCGKDTLALALKQAFGASIVSYGEFPKNGAHAQFGMVGIHPKAFEDTKDEPNADFMGLTPRQAYIDHAQKWMKPEYGPDIYARLMVQNLTKARTLITVVPDLGFQEEVDCLIPLYGIENMMVIQINRAEYTYARFKDSRDYVDNRGCKFMEVENPEGRADLMINEVLPIVREWTTR